MIFLNILNMKSLPLYLFIILTIHKTNSSDSSENPVDIVVEENKLEKFYQECLNERGIAIKTERTVITPVFERDMNDMYKMYDEEPDDLTKFVDRYRGKYDGVEKQISKFEVRVVNKCSLDIRKALKFGCYSIFYLHHNNNLYFSGTYTINDPNALGWSKVNIYIRFPFRERGIGREVTAGILSFINPLVGYKHNIYDFFDKSTGYHIFNEGDDENGHYYAINQNARINISETEVEFRGLEAEIDERNTYSISLHSKCGWEFIGSKGGFDLEGEFQTYKIFRYPKQGN